MCSHHPSSRKFLFIIDGDQYRRSQPITIQSCANYSQWYIYKTIPTPKLQKMLMTGQKDCQNQRTRKLALRLCPLRMPEAKTAKVSSTWLWKCELNNDKNGRNIRVERGRTTKPQPCTKNHRQVRNAESRRNRLLQGNFTVPKVKPENMHSNIEQAILRIIKVSTYVCIHTYILILAIRYEVMNVKEEI